jgi:diguanylate cyclase (GGDEF)-like protein
MQTADKAGVSTVGTSDVAGPSLAPTSASDADVADVDPLLEESRSRASAPLTSRERLTSILSAGGYLVAAAAMLIGFDSSLSDVRLATAGFFIIAYALISRVEFEIGTGAAVPTEIVLVPMLFALPPATVPVAVAVAYMAGAVAEVAEGKLRPQRLPVVLSTCWHSIGPAFVLAMWGTRQPTWHDLPLYAVALLAQFGFDLASSVVRESLGFGISPRAVMAFLRPVFLVDALLAPVGLTAAFVIAPEPLALLGVLPLAGLLWVFARDRRDRIDQALALSHAYHGASDQARRDGLTGVFNRLAWDEALTAGQQSIRDSKQPASLIVVDVDALKEANDGRGHEFGDSVIRSLARALSHTVREQDVVARVGGDEFAILLPNCGETEAQVAVQRLTEAIHRQRVDGSPLSASIGTATCLPSSDLRATLRIADSRMYDAKRRQPSRTATLPVDRRAG